MEVSFKELNICSLHLKETLFILAVYVQASRGQLNPGIIKPRFEQTCERDRTDFFNTAAQIEANQNQNI